MGTAITTTATTMSSMAIIVTITVSTATSMERMMLPITGIDTMAKRWVMATTVAATAPTRRGSSVPAWERRKTRSSRLWQKERGASRMSSAQLAQAPAAVAAALPSQQLSRRHLPRLHRLQRQTMASEGGRALALPPSSCQKLSAVSGVSDSATAAQTLAASSISSRAQMAHPAWT